MPSPAASVFSSALLKARTFVALTNDVRLRPISRTDSRLYLHAALAVYVAAWEGYIERLVANFFSEISDPQLAKFLSLHSVVITLANRAAERFNTPNAENSRTLLVEYTGYDPINDWIWPQRLMAGPQVRGRLNEILKVRHSFAHGFSMPSFDWNTSPAGEVRLTMQTLGEIEAFFVNIVRRTDGGMAKHIKNHYNPNLSWQ